MEYLVFGAAMVVFVGVLLAKGVYDAHQDKKKLISHLRHKYGELQKREYKPEQYATISGYFSKHPAEGQLDDITWNDLNMDDVFKHLNDTYSSAGEEILYYTLRTPRFDEEVLSHLEELIQYFSNHTEERVRLQLLLCELGRTGRFSMYNYLEHLDLLGNRSNVKHWIRNLCYIPCIVLCVLSPAYGVLSLVVLMLYNILSYFKEKNEIDPYITSFAYIMRLQETAGKVEKLNIKTIGAETAVLHEHRKQLGRFRRGSFWLMSAGRMSGSGNPLDILLDYCRMACHIDLIKFNSMLMQVRERIDDVDMLFYTLGSLETAISIGAYRNSLDGGFCVPSLAFDGARGIWADNLYHPLLEKPVKNSIKADRGVLLTGSNASGKSTFLKTVAINAVFAQTIHTVLADSYEGGVYQICSSMALKDDITSGESYYMVEIRAIKRILDLIGRERRVLCFVDEVLRGTNTVERIAAGAEILLSLTSAHAMCFAATHDVELTGLLEKYYDNYHFEEDIVENDIYFNYRLMKGKAATRNAIRLLSVMGYQKEIIENAERRAERFMQAGKWVE